MNKQRYLAELQRLLVFMTGEDRAETVRRYAELFDSVGPEGEAALIASLGSPTKAAISLSRGYEPGKLPETIPGAPELPEKPKAALTQAEEDPWGDLPNFDLPEYEEPAKPEAVDRTTDEPLSVPDPPGRYTPRPAGSDRRAGRGMSLWLGVPLFILFLFVLAIPLAVVCLALFLVLLVPGAAVLFGAYLVFVGGLWCQGYMADAILLFGAAFIVLAFGIILLFGGLWLGIELASAYCGGVGWVTGKLLGRRAAEYA